ncbi:MAG: hypothetical protein IPK16_27525 [Anaerolineales bacterium]|nr:hypothetical protein [Anaerolineales bacterium]
MNRHELFAGIFTGDLYRHLCGRQGQTRHLRLCPDEGAFDVAQYPQPTAVKILGNLAGAGIIETRKAPVAVRLGRPPQDVSLLDIFTAVESGKPMFRQDYQMRVTGDKPTRAQQTVYAVLTQAEAAMKARLAQTTIANLLASLNQ